jgi:transcriptional regulator with XRE-family HTH domain
MVPPERVREVQRLLSEGALSYRDIARRVNISRGTVLAIAKGRRPDYDALRQARAAENSEPAEPPCRCPACGYRVYLPCRICSLRARQERAQASRSFQLLWADRRRPLPPGYAAELLRWREPADARQAG